MIRLKTLVSNVVISTIVASIIFQAGLIANQHGSDRQIPEILPASTIIGSDDNLTLVSDILMTRFNSEGGFKHGTYLGGTQSGDDTINHIQVDDLGNVYAVGRTEAMSFPVTPGAYDETLNGSGDLFIVKFNSTLSDLQYSTFLGGDDTESVGGIHLNTDGSLIIVGSTSSSNFPTTNGAFCETLTGEDDGFLVIMNPQGTNLEYATFIGGGKDDHEWSLQNVLIWTKRRLRP